jgi:hypothetical protein
MVLITARAVKPARGSADHPADTGMQCPSPAAPRLARSVAHVALHTPRDAEQRRILLAIEIDLDQTSSGAPRCPAVQYPFRPQGMGHSSPPAGKAPLIFAPAPGAQTHLQGGFGTQGWRACAPPPPDDELKKNEGNAETGTDVKGKAPKKWDSSRYMCPHNRRKYLCRDCGGSQVCEHDKVLLHTLSVCV